MLICGVPMKTDGMWTGEFATTEGSFGGGVVLLDGERIIGGDSGYFYSGKVEFDPTASPATIHAVVFVEPFLEGYESVFKTTGKSYTLDITGKFMNEDVIVGYGVPVEFPESRLSLRLSRKKVA